MTTQYVYHWTHRRNLESILVRGLRCDYAETVKAEVWVCDGSRVGWALGHIAYRHGWDADDMVLIRIRRDKCEWVRTAFTGVWVTRENVPTTAIGGVRLDLLTPFVPASRVRRKKRHK